MVNLRKFRIHQLLVLDWELVASKGDSVVSTSQKWEHAEQGTPAA